MSSSSESEPESVKLNEETDINNLLPNKSREKYLKAYENFVSWKYDEDAKPFSETVFLAYFQHLAKTLQPSTLWSIYSMLKTTMNTKNNIQINTYSKLTEYLKRVSKGHKSKKSKVLTSQNVETFLNEAPDDNFLAIKVALIFGIHGACRGRELINMTVENVEKHSDQLLLVNLTDTKTNIDRSFTIRGEYKNIVEKYQNLRPSDIETNRFFIRYQNGKCFKQHIGKNKISKMPEIIAKYLKLPDSHLYTGHCFRRTSGTLLADSRADLTNLKRHRGRKSSGVAEVYIEDSVANKPNISMRVDEDTKLRRSSVDVPIVSLSPSQSTSLEREMYGRCKSSGVAEVYIEDSVDIKPNISMPVDASTESRRSSVDAPFQPLSPRPSTSNQREMSPLSQNDHPPDSEIITITQVISHPKKLSVPKTTVTINLRKYENISNIHINF